MKTEIGNNPESAINYYQKARSKLYDTISGTMLNTQKIEDHMHKEANPILKRINKITSLTDSFYNEINKFRSDLSELNSLKAMLKDLENHSKNIKDIENQKLSIENKLNALGIEKEKVSKKMNSLIESNSYKDFLHIIEKRDAIQKRLNENEITIMNYLSPLDRPIKKFLKLIDDGEISFSESKRINVIIESYKISEDDMPLFTDALTKMNHVIDRIESKNENAIKLKKRVNEILHTDALTDMCGLKSKLFQELKILELEISEKNPVEKLELEDKLNLNESEMMSIRNSLQMLDNEIENLKMSMEKTRKTIIDTSKNVLNEDLSLLN